MLFILLLLTVHSINIDGDLYRFDKQVEYLPHDLSLRWTFPSETEVTFEYWIPLEQYEFYTWAGIALQDPRDARDHFRCDYFIAELNESPQMTDRYAERNGLPQLDTELGCTDDITSWSEVTEDHLIIYFSRLLLSPDIACDVQMPYGKPLLVKWAIGHMIDGQIQQHDLRDMGFEYFVLSTEYLDDNGDERAIYGPWWEVHPQQVRLANETGIDMSDPEIPLYES